MPASYKSTSFRNFRWIIIPVKKPEISYQAEEYLEAIYRLEKKKCSAKTMELAKKLNVVPGSITNTIENLEKRGLVSHIPYKGVKLTEKGRKIAANVLRKHRLAERLLTDFLHLNWSEVHDAACKLEHALSPKILNSLESSLGNPKTCPHGNPIPTYKGKLDEPNSKPLAELNSGESGIVVKISEENPTILRVLESLGAIPKTLVKIEGKESFNGPLHISINGKRHKLEQKIARCIHVKSAIGTNGEEKHG
ncbi:MAG: metal-dependent transcriptional regulator [Candidatus Bathyarchaeota archaeon]|nr:metal-dependent transcriptional regulator [Candidatus Bathyarchaeota archaeon]